MKPNKSAMLLTLDVAQ